MTKKYEAALFIDGKLVPAQSGKTFEIRVCTSHARGASY